MTENTVRVVEYYYVDVRNKPGEAAKLLAQLKEARVNLELFTAFPEGRHSQLDFVPTDRAAFLEVAKANKWKLVGPKRGILIEGEDRVGVGAELLHDLGTTNINITAATAIKTGDRYGMVLWVKPRDVEKAARTLGVSTWLEET